MDTLDCPWLCVEAWVPKFGERPTSRNSGSFSHVFDHRPALRQEEALLRANGQAQLLLLRRLASDAELLLEERKRKRERRGKLKTTFWWLYPLFWLVPAFLVVFFWAPCFGGCHLSLFLGSPFLGSLFLFLGWSRFLVLLCLCRWLFCLLLVAGGAIRSRKAVELLLVGHSLLAGDLTAARCCVFMFPSLSRCLFLGYLFF